MVQIEWGMLLAQVVNFLILMFALAKFAYKPLMKILADRQIFINESLDNAKKEQETAGKLKQEYQLQLADARNQAQTIIDKATRFAEQTKEEILNEARAEQARMFKVAQAEIIREREIALGELKNEVVALSLAAAAKIIEKNLDYDTNSKLVNEVISKLDNQSGGLPC